MKWVSSVALAVVLAHGWIWTNYLKEKGHIDEAARFWILVALSVMLLIQQILLARPRPCDRSAVERQRKLAENCLESLLAAYYEAVEDTSKADPTVRANLSLPTRNIRYAWAYLKIYYFACPRTCAYSADELNIKWTKGTGAIGSAWKSKDITLFDSEDPRFHGPAESVSKHQQEVASRIKSILAIPIVGASGKIVGVLALDSTEGIEKTKLNEPEILKIAQAYADALSPLCFSAGVS